MEEDPSRTKFAQYKPLLKHQCFDSCCSCEHFLSLAAQFMFELKYPPEYIHSFLTNFYYREPHLPLVCVGLIAGMFIHQQKYQEAQELLESAIHHAKSVTVEHWTPQEIEKYHHVLSILIFNVLLPQGFTEIASAYLDDSAHPSAVLPLGNEFVSELKSAIEETKLSFERQFIPESQSAAKVKQSLEPSVGSSSSSKKAPVNRNVTNVQSSKHSAVAKPKNLKEQLTMMLRLQFQRLGKFVLPISILTFIVTAVVLTMKKKKDSWFVGKLTAAWELFENAIFPNYGLRRLQRNRQQ
eukprot:CAMPEP_0206186906 /NCGR_PEP_ID=MMETSP0166-20121206/2682_1 /ASSEMBLY_ACC=CAM_ASM_000260 /TAXON_ID=95228 /ORGANISM="Vannella robusta, Strain DIVA3 518/3/11/1/6" /LENGTH=295 /DNA_ID=CAMNT_0053602381 /DNA_START=184 /DNA_END=1071 /DNA_ORIENTATION=+